MSNVRAINRASLITPEDDARLNGSGPGIYFGFGTPEGNVAAPPGSIFVRSDASSSPSSGIYRKTFASGNASTGWIADAPASFGAAMEFNESGSAIALTSATNFYPWVTGSTGPVSGTGLVTFDGSNKRLVIGANGAGTYHVTFTTAGTLGSANDMECAIFVNETANEFVRSDLHVSNQASYVNLSVAGLITLAVGDYVSARFSSDANSQTWTVHHASLAIHRVGA